MVLIGDCFVILSGMNSEVVELCRAMVAIASVNPQDEQATEQPYGEDRIAAFVADWFGKNDLDCQIQQVQPGRSNVLATAQGKDKSKTLLFVRPHGYGGRKGYVDTAI